MRRLLWCALLAWRAVVAAPADDPFAPALALADGRSVELRFDIAPDHALYRDRIDARSQTPGVRLGPLDVPPGVRRADPVTGETVELLVGRVAVRIPVLAGDGTADVDIDFQGCTDTGVCLAPRRRSARLSLRDGHVLAAAWSDGAVAATDLATTSTAVDRALASGHLLGIGAIFLGSGLLLSLTPCALPMVPILAALLLGGTGAGRGRAFALTVAYTLGMALSYTAAGVAAGLLGEGLATLLQGPLFVGPFAALLAVLALSMFGVFDWQIAAGVQERVTAWSNRLPGGRLPAVFAMGALSALLVGPCVAVPFAGALAFIGRTGDVFLGAVALFSLALGLGAPLMAVGLSAGALRPRAGRWAHHLQPAFGLVLVAVAAWMAAPVLGVRPTLALAALVLAAGALGAWRRHDAPAGRLAAAATGALAVLALLGAAADSAGQRAPWWVLTSSPEQTARGGFAPVADAAALDAVIAAASRPVLVFVHADWCLTCRRIERYTFGDAAVQRRLAGLVLLRVDVGGGTPAQREMLRRHGLYGPPAILVFRPGDGVREAGRLVGDATPADLLALLDGAGIR